MRGSRSSSEQHYLKDLSSGQELKGTDAVGSQQMGRGPAWGEYQPSTAREGAKDHCSLVGAGRDWGAAGLDSGPPGGCHPRLFTLPWLVQRGWFRVHPSLCPSSGPGPTTTRQGLKRTAALASDGPPLSRGAGQPGFPLLYKEALAVPVPASSSHQGQQRVPSWKMLPPGWMAPSAALIRVLRGASMSTGL